MNTKSGNCKESPEKRITALEVQVQELREAQASPCDAERLIREMNYLLDTADRNFKKHFLGCCDSDAKIAMRKEE
jgi:hypothetical protein